MFIMPKFFQLIIFIIISAFAFANNRDIPLRDASVASTPIYYKHEPRQYHLYPVNNAIEQFSMSLILAIGIGIIGIPLILLLFNMFTGSSNNSYMTPNTPYGPGYGTTTTAHGRKKRNIPEEIRDHPLEDKLIDIIQRYLLAENKINYVKTLIQ